MDQLRVGLLGCGRIARYFHLGALAAMSDVDLLAVADPDHRALDAARLVVPDAASHTDWRAVIEDPAVEAVVVCLPSHLHHTAGVAALRAGTHVYLEKPIALDAAGATALLDAQAAAPGVVAMAGFNFRHHPLFRSARHLLDQGTVGTIIGVRTTFGAAPRDVPGWKQARATGGGALLDLGSHHADLVRFLLADVETVSAADIRSIRHEADTVSFTMRLSNGVTVQSLVTQSGPQQDRIEIHGVAGELLLDRYRARRPVFTPTAAGDGRRARLLAGLDRMRGETVQVRGTLVPPTDPSFAAALRAFSHAVRRGRAAAPTLADGAASLAVVLAAERSAVTGRAEPVTDVPVEP